MQHIQKINPLTGSHTALPLHITTILPSLRTRIAQRLQETGVVETITESILALSTFSLVGGLLFSLYRALENYTIIPLP